MTSHAGLDPARDADILIEQGEHTREGAADANPFRDGEGGGGSSSRAVQDLASKSPVQIAVRRLAYDKVAMMSLGVVLLFVILGIFAETINAARGVDPLRQDYTYISPGGYPTFTASPEHPFGIETGTGRDLLARWLIGIRPSLTIADFAAAAHFSCLDYISDVDWDRSDLVRQWYATIKSRPAFRGVLADQVPGLHPAPHYAQLDF